MGSFTSFICFAQHGNGIYLLDNNATPSCRYDIHWNNKRSAEIEISEMNNYCENNGSFVVLDCISDRRCSFGPRKWKTNVRFTRTTKKMIWSGVENESFTFFNENLCLVNGNEKFCSGDMSYRKNLDDNNIVEILAISKIDKKALLTNNKVYPLSDLAGTKNYVIDGCINWGFYKICEGQRGVSIGSRSKYPTLKQIRILKIFSEEAMLVDNSGVMEIVKAKNTSVYEAYSKKIKVRKKHCHYILDDETKEKYTKQPIKKLMNQCQNAGFDYCFTNRGKRVSSCEYNIEVYGVNDK